ncbi:MAG: allophanate hydrolase [Alphaproteobacteria bacterium]
MIPARLDRRSLHAAYALGLTPEAVVTAVFERLRAVDDAGIFLHLAAADELRAAAAALPPFDPERFPLWGLVAAVKDNIDVAGMPTTAACPAFAYTATADAHSVSLLREAGTLILGKTNLDQFATGLVGVRTPYPVPRNALDPALVPGGSSSGSAVAVARGLASFALGTDTAGSGRVPAALNGIVGFKPSLGAVSTRGVVPACRTLDCVSVFATGVDDAWRVTAVLAAYDEADPYARRRPLRPSGGPPAGLAVGVPDPASQRFFGDAAQEAAFAHDLGALEALGCRVHPLDFAPFHEVAALLYEGAWLAERYVAVADLLARRPDALHPTTAAIIAPAAQLSAARAFADQYRLAALRRDIETAIDGLDLLAVPSIQRLVTRSEVEVDPIGPNRELGTYTNFANLLDLCAVTLPTAARADGGPGSLTLLARGGDDGALLPLARALAGAPAAEPAVDADRLELAVVGAHLSGMPLNAELRDAGARLERTVRTRPDYRLFALSGTPARPGLLRVADGEGGAVEVEVWSLEPAAFARFVAAIPAPLGVGRVRLDNGTAPCGFLVEAAATAAAQDITAFGGWRRYVAANGR